MDVGGRGGRGGRGIGSGSRGRGSSKGYGSDGSGILVIFPFVNPIVTVVATVVVVAVVVTAALGGGTRSRIFSLHVPGDEGILGLETMHDIRKRLRLQRKQERKERGNKTSKGRREEEGGRRQASKRGRRKVERRGGRAKGEADSPATRTILLFHGPYVYIDHAAHADDTQEFSQSLDAGGKGEYMRYFIIIIIILLHLLLLLILV